MSKKDEEIKAELQVRRWLESCVVGLNLCPFARVPFEQGRVRVEACFESSLLESGYFFKNELEALMNSSSEALETSLLLFCPRSFDDFEKFLDFVDEMALLIESNELSDDVQLVAFHPNYQFEGEEENARSNYTNRSPCPIIHIIRQDSMARAISAYGEENTDEIPSSNIRRLDGLTLEEFRTLFLTID